MRPRPTVVSATVDVQTDVHFAHAILVLMNPLSRKATKNVAALQTAQADNARDAKAPQISSQPMNQCHARTKPNDCAGSPELRGFLFLPKTTCKSTKNMVI